MSDVVHIPLIGGFVSERERRRVGDCAFAKNVTYSRVAVDGRRGTRTAIVGSASGGFKADGPVVGINKYRSRTGSEYRVFAGYNMAGGSTSLRGLYVAVYAGFNVVAFAGFQANPATPYMIEPWGVSMVPFGDSLYVCGEALGKLIRCRFQRSGVTVAEATLQDRTLLPFSVADDPGPWLGRLYRCLAMEAFQNRMFFAGSRDEPDKVFWSNIGDALAVSAQNYIPIQHGGKVSGLATAGDYLMILKERSTHFARGGFTSSQDTSVEVLDSNIGALGQRCIAKMPGGRVAFMSHEGVCIASVGEGVRVISGDISGWLRGMLRDYGGASLEKLVPTAESLRDAPMAYSAKRNELYVALSSGASLAATSNPTRADMRDFWLVGNLDGERVRWNIWSGGPAATPVFSTHSIYCGVDSDGNDETLYGTHNGRIHQANLGGTDTDSGGTDRTIASLVVPRFIGDTDEGGKAVTGRSQIRALEATFVERFNSTATSGALQCVYAAGSPDGSFAGSPRTTGVHGRNGMPYFGASGTALPITMKTLGLSRRVMGLRAVAQAGNEYVALQGSNGPLPMVQSVTAYIDRIQRLAA